MPVQERNSDVQGGVAVVLLISASAEFLISDNRLSSGSCVMLGS
jgi:hypothetical protein